MFHSTVVIILGIADKCADSTHKKLCKRYKKNGKCNFSGPKARCKATCGFCKCHYDNVPSL